MGKGQHSEPHEDLGEEHLGRGHGMCRSTLARVELACGETSEKQVGQGAGGRGYIRQGVPRKGEELGFYSYLRCKAIGVP